MDKKRFAELVRQKIQVEKSVVAAKPEVLASQFLDQVVGGSVNYPPGFINGLFSQFYQSQANGGVSFRDVMVPRIPDNR